MASQDVASQLDSTPALLEDVVPKGFDKMYVCRLLVFDDTGTSAMVRIKISNARFSFLTLYSNAISSFLDFSHILAWRCLPKSGRICCIR